MAVINISEPLHNESTIFGTSILWFLETPIIHHWLAIYQFTFRLPITNMPKSQWASSADAAYRQAAQREAAEQELLKYEKAQIKALNDELNKNEPPKGWETPHA